MMLSTKKTSLLLLHAIAASAITVTASTAVAQAVVPIRELSPVEAKTSAPLGAILGLRPLSGGRLLINDGLHRQLIILDGNLSNPTVMMDSVAVGGQSYGPRPSPFIPYLADSTLFVDGTSLSLLVIDPTGKIAHVMSAPKPADLRFLSGSASGVDAKGDLVYRGALVINTSRISGPPVAGGAATPPIAPPDSSPIVRASFDTRQVDTLGRVKTQSGNRGTVSADANGKMAIRMTINPLQTVDEWAVLSDGTIAFVRGHDYHVDLLKPDGKTFSTEKLPFDWKRLSDGDKQALIDSARTAMDKAQADAKATAAANGGRGGAEMAMVAGMAAMGGGMGGGGMSVEIHRDGGGGAIGGGGPPGGMGGFQMGAPVIEFVSLKEIADYYPAIRQGAAKADLDGNLWILPTTSAQAKHGELVYDVVNNRGVLFQRVRLPEGRAIAGFGHNGIVYLMYKDGTAGWMLERTKILNAARAAD
ncbi:MAG: hypothetical protein ABJC26_16860 [Gemmatimonadaceae bacterium]